MTNFSLVFLTKHSSGIETLLEILQHKKQNFELVVVDDSPNDRRMNSAQQFIRDIGINLRFWGSSRSGGLANAMNTGALCSSADYLIFIQENSIPYWNANKSIRSKETITLHSGDFYCESPLKFIETINGFDERSDRGSVNWIYDSIIQQAKMNGFPVTEINQKLRNLVPIDWKKVSPNPFDFSSFRSKIQRDIIPVDINGFKLLIPSDFVIGPHFRTGNYEPIETRLITEYLQEGDTVLDVGANIGYYTLTAANKVGVKGKVIAVEPFGPNFQMLRKNIEINRVSNVDFFFAAAGKQYESEKPIYCCSYNAGDHRMWEDKKENRNSITVEVRTIDEMTERYKQIHLMKVDVQGSETNVLLGAENTIRKQKKMALAIEYWPWGLRQAGSNYKQFLDIVYNHEFSVYWINEDKKEVIQKTKPEMLEMIDEKTMDFVNLWCVKGE